jgi:hypothetical protein
VVVAAYLKILPCQSSGGTRTTSDIKMGSNPDEIRIGYLQGTGLDLS